jgi:cytochrome c553
MLRRCRVLAACGLAALVLCVSAVTLAGQIGGRPTRPHVTPPKGPPRQVIFKYCTSCHGIDDYAYYAQDLAAWDALLDAKHRGLDVPLPAPERAILLVWLAERFGPTTNPFPRTYVAQEITTFFSDTEAEALLQRACTSCHEADRFNNARFSPDRWRVVIVGMRERGAELDDEELERLVEWLGRTKGTNDQ